MRYPTLAAPSFLRPVAIFAGLTSLVQATVNIVLSILGILVYECQIILSPDSPYLEKCIVTTYFQGPECTVDSSVAEIDGILPSSTVFAWVIAYLAVDVIWFIISSVAIYFATKFERKTVLPCLYVWTLFTMGVCCMDLAATIYFAVQLQVLTFAASLEGSSNNNSSAFWRLSQECGGGNTLLSVPGLLMTMTARYYIFWILNAALVAVIGVSALGISNKSLSDQDFFDENVSSQHIFGGGDSDNSQYYGSSRRDVSVIDGWKEPWQDVPVIRIPKVKPVSNVPSFLYRSSSFQDSGPVAGERASASATSYSQPQVREETGVQSSMPPPPPLPPPPVPHASSSSGGRDGRQQEERRTRPKKHPPPPLDQKPLRPALKNRF